MAQRALTLVPVRGSGEQRVDVLDDGRVRVGETIFDVRTEGDHVVAVGSDVTRRCWVALDGDTHWVFLDGQVYELTAQQPEARPRRRTSSGPLAAPMPATVRRILVKEGDAVKPGDSLIVLEAMKMELPVRAGAPGMVKAILCREGDLVQPGVTLVELDESDGTAPDA